jgi:hypothetical protein
VEYNAKQQELVTKAVETAATYLPVAEAATAIVAEIDVLAAFATAAALAPGEYVRPTLHPRGSGIFNLQVRITFNILSEGRWKGAALWLSLSELTIICRVQ